MEGIILFHSLVNSAAAAKSFQSCPTLCDPIDGSPSGSSVPGILQARTLEWAAIAFSNDGLWRFKVLSLPLCMVEIFDNIKMFFHLAN